MRILYSIINGCIQISNVEPGLHICHIIPEEIFQIINIIPITEGQSENILTLTFILDCPKPPVTCHIIKFHMANIMTSFNLYKLYI